MAAARRFSPAPLTSHAPFFANEFYRPEVIAVAGHDGLAGAGVWGLGPTGPVRGSPADSATGRPARRLTIEATVNL